MADTFMLNCCRDNILKAYTISPCIVFKIRGDKYNITILIYEPKVIEVFRRCLPHLRYLSSKTFEFTCKTRNVLRDSTDNLHISRTSSCLFLGCCLRRTNFSKSQSQWANLSCTCLLCRNCLCLLNWSSRLFSYVLH